jgi:hypothetical protein
LFAANYFYLATKYMEDQIAASPEAWLATLREHVSEVESDGREAFKQRRQLVRFLVQSITVGRDEDGNTRVEVTYRFGPPTAQERIGSPQDEERRFVTAGFSEDDPHCMMHVCDLDERLA